MSLQLIILAGLGIILLVVFIRLYYVILIGIARLLFGRYSSRYFVIYKKYTGQSPYGYCIKDDFINYIAGFYKNPESVDKYSTDSKILFQDHEYGTSYKNILKQSKKPFCVNSIRLKQFDLKVLGFKDALFTVEMKKYYFFVNGKFYLGQLTFKNPEKDSIQKIIGVIGKKYLSGNAINSDRFFIEGKNESHLYCNYNGFHLSISYLSRANPSINQLIDDYWGNSTTVELGNKSTMEEELMDKL
jgi:hypothetical protein